ncbi:MAG: TolC family protein [Blastocatellia bacterium]|nr:TolC family protein [Blastocatellia bacterium]
MIFNTLHRYTLLTLVVWCCSWPLAVAQTPPPDSKKAETTATIESPADQSGTASQYVSETGGTTIEELLKLALANNKELAASRQQIRQAEARLTQARLRPNPTLEVEHGNDLLFGNEGENEFGVSFSQPIELGGKRTKRMRIAALAIEMARAQLADAERNLAAQMRSLYGEALAAAARLDLLGRTKALNQQMVRVMEVRLRAGDASRLDSSLLLAETNRFEAQRVTAEGQISEILLQIKTLAGLAPDEPLMLSSRFEPPAISLTAESAVQVAMQNRPDLQAARLREEMAEAGIELARAQIIPNPSLFVRYSQATDVIEGLLAPSEKIIDRDKKLSFGVSIPLPLSNRNQGEVAEAGAQAAQARVQREGLELAVRRDVLVAFRRYETARRSMEVLDQGVLSQSQESFRTIKLAYDLGEMRLLDLINQQHLLVDTQMNYAMARKDYYAAIIELERAIGSPISSSKR